MLQFRCIITTIALFVCLVTVAHAGPGKSVEDFSATAGKMLNIIQQLQSVLQEDSSPVKLRIRLIQEVEKLQVCRLFLDERMRNREARLKNGNFIAKGRHEEFSALLNQRLQDIDDLLQRIVAQRAFDQEDLSSLSNLLKQFISTKQAPLHGSVPYRQLQMPTVAPRTSPLVTPAYQTSTIVSVTADLQGAEETLRQRSGNDADQAALLIALLRAAGYPARYVRGVVEFFPDLEMARNLIGGEWSPIKYLVDVTAGQMHVTQMARRPLEKHQFLEGGGGSPAYVMQCNDGPWRGTHDENGGVFM